MKEQFQEEKHRFSQIVNVLGKDYELMVKLHIRYNYMDYRVSSTMLSSGGYDAPVIAALEEMNRKAHELGRKKLLDYQDKFQPSQQPRLPFPADDDDESETGKPQPSA